MDLIANISSHLYSVVQISDFLFRSSFPDLLFDIVKEVMAEFISERVESFFGFGKRRSSSSSGSDAVDWIGKIINIVRRKALNQSKGCL